MEAPNHDGSQSWRRRPTDIRVHVASNTHAELIGVSETINVKAFFYEPKPKSLTRKPKCLANYLLDAFPRLVWAVWLVGIRTAWKTFNADVSQ